MYRLQSTAPTRSMRLSVGVLLAYSSSGAGLVTLSSGQSMLRCHHVTTVPGATMISAEASSLTIASIAMLAAGWSALCQSEAESSKVSEELPTWTLSELSAHDGTNPQKPLLVAVDGLIYNVESARRLYGPGAEYAGFAGRDATRLLARGVVSEDESSSAVPLNLAQRTALRAWVASFRAKYEVVGVLRLPAEVAAMEAAAAETAAAGERLLGAAASGDVAALRRELHAGTPLTFADDSGMCALHYAAEHGQLEATEALLALGAEVDAVGSKGRTALHHAAAAGHHAIAVALVDAGAAVDAVAADGWTPLLFASRASAAEGTEGAEGAEGTEVASMLLACGAAVDAASDAGVTPLIAAATYGRTPTVRVLLASSADTSKRVRGRTAQEWAEAEGYPETVELLQAHHE